jgi:hypothetical protein
VLVAVERLLLRIRHPASRAAELTALHQRVRDELAADVDDEEKRLAREVHEAKLAAADAMQDVASCASCASGQPWPTGHYAGGGCCAGVTADLFGDGELPALVHAGTRQRDLTPPAGSDAHAGCAFRGPTGCTLDVEHRPARCVHYTCQTLRRELHRVGKLDGVEAKLAALDESMRQYKLVHRARLDREVLAPLIDAIERAR